MVYSDRLTLLSLNRFEKKKNAVLAVEAFAGMKSKLPPHSKSQNMRLVLAGKHQYTPFHHFTPCLPHRWLRPTPRRQHAHPLFTHRPRQVALTDVQRRYPCLIQVTSENPPLKHDEGEPRSPLPSQFHHLATHGPALEPVYQSPLVHTRQRTLRNWPGRGHGVWCPCPRMR